MRAPCRVMDRALEKASLEHRIRWDALPVAYGLDHETVLCSSLADMVSSSKPYSLRSLMSAVEPEKLLYTSSKDIDQLMEQLSSCSTLLPEAGSLVPMLTHLNEAEAIKVDCWSLQCASPFSFSRVPLLHPHWIESGIILDQTASSTRGFMRLRLLL